MARKIDIGEKWKPEKATARQIECMQKVEAADFEIYSRKLELICAEAREIFAKMGSAQMLQSGDLAVGIYTAEGDLASCVIGVYLHLITGQIPIKYVLEKYSLDPTVGINEGDMFFCNEALYGGIHNPDMIMFMPIFTDGELIAWALAAVHEGDTGAIDPGGMSARSQTRYDEGMHLTPVKVGENFKLKQDLLDMMENMVRDPRQQTIDLKARAAACMRVRKRLLEEIVDKKGVDFVIGLMRLNIETSIEAAKKRITKLSDGTYRSVLFLDGAGLQEGLLRIAVKLIKQGDRIIIDLEGTSPETSLGPWNAFAHMVAAASAVYLFQYLFHDLPPSNGCLVPFTFNVPPGSLLDASPDAAVAVSVITLGHTTFYGMHICFSKLLFNSDYRDLACAGMWMPAPPCLFGGVNQFGQQVAGLLADQLNGTGTGARRNGDGLHAAGFNYCPIGVFPDAEFNEIQLPWVYLFRNKLMQDNHGFGKYRGGSGLMFAMMPHNTPGMVFACSQGGCRIPPNTGLFGGYATLTPPGIQVTGTNLKEMMAKSDPNIPFDVIDLVTNKPIAGEYQVESMLRSFRWINEGDIFLQPTVAGGSYGDVLEREPSMVIKDVRDGITSHWVAQNIYKVVYDPETLRVDEEMTAKARADERAARMNRGMSYSDFMNNWSVKKPPEEILGSYGNWPDPGSQPY
ncbi:MAG: hydantoinase B/oxoprolinase family protein [Thermincola sp.]|jgi:acetophenone carboxylase|nr:hydantoinase B/oxoprolinase family protein [Thermincola sp.]MDT3704614.1 hydantoinase B/oxoprolinase family protein [Thermincola sp.]